MKKIVLIIVAIVVIGLGFWLYWSNIKPELKQKAVLDPQNATYIIEDQEITLINGASEEELITQYFGNEVRGDFNNDGVEDTAFLLVQDGGGSGAFYYVAAVLGSVDDSKGTNASKTNR
jgi:ABC-type nickel/cobalt efflux system permease component RcnA